MEKVISAVRKACGLCNKKGFLFVKMTVDRKQVLVCKDCVNQISDALKEDGQG